MAFRESRASEIDILDRLVQECDAIRHSGALERFDIASSFSLSPSLCLRMRHTAGVTKRNKMSSVRHTVS